MTDNFITFKRFNDSGLAMEISELLKAESILYRIEENKQFFDAAFANNASIVDISLKLMSKDFSAAQKVIGKYYEQIIDTVEKDYYLFEFTDQELLDIISKPDEWGEFDYQLALKLLSDRGKEIKPEIVDLLAEQRTKELSAQTSTSKYLIYRGYFSAIFGGIFAIFFGYDLAYSKKTLPNGEQIFTYKDEERNHGQRIIVIGITSLIFWVTIMIYLKTQEY